jgi:uncharacterized protein YycO
MERRKSPIDPNLYEGDYDVIRLRFLNEKGIFPGLIKWFTWSSISHVEFVFSDGYLGADFPGGVQIKPFAYAHPKEIWYGVVECSDEVSKKVEAFARAQIGKPYSLLGIIGFVVKHDFNKKGSFFCSELVLAAFESADYPLLDLAEIDRVSPGDLFESPLVHIEE